VGDRLRSTYNKPQSLNQPQSPKREPAREAAPIPDALYGINAVGEAIGVRPVEYVLVAEGQHGQRVQTIINSCRTAGIPLRFAPRVALDRASGTTQHQNVVAICSAKRYDSLESLLATPQGRAVDGGGTGEPGGQSPSLAEGALPVPGSRSAFANPERRTSSPARREAPELPNPEPGAANPLTTPAPPLLVVLDGVEDPANLGAVIRTAVAAGSTGVIIPERRAAGLSAAVARAAAGALEHMRVARVTNLVRTLVELKERNVWVYGFEAQAEKSYLDLDYSVPCALVMGGEGRGLHRLVREACDQLAAIPLHGPVQSLNISVAAGIVLYEAARQRYRG